MAGAATILEKDMPRFAWIARAAATIVVTALSLAACGGSDTTSATASATPVRQRAPDAPATAAQPAPATSIGERVAVAKPSMRAVGTATLDMRIPLLTATVTTSGAPAI